MSGEVIIYVIIYVVPYKMTQPGHDAQKWFLIVGALCMPLRRDVELRRRRYEHSQDATQLDVALSWVELSRYKPGLSGLSAYNLIPAKAGA